MHLLLDYVIQVLLLHHIYQEHSGDGPVLGLTEVLLHHVSLTRQLTLLMDNVVHRMEVRS